MEGVTIAPRPSTQPKLAFMTTVAAIAWCALVLQFYLAVTLSMSRGTTLIGAIVWFFSFFTVLTNTIAAVSLTILITASGTRVGRWFAPPVVQSGIAASMALVAIAYELLLRSLWNPQGLQFVADLMLHDLVPVLYVMHWIFFVPKGSLKWADVLWWLPYPALYLVYALMRGAFLGQYPYAFLDVGVLGYGRMWVNTAALLIGSVCVGLALVTIDHVIGRARVGRR
jgi:hypothetical protein